MRTVDELVTWLRAQLDDDERVATNGGKLSGDQWSALEISPSRVTWEVIRRGGGVVAEAAQWEAEHIARHDPAGVLAEVDAKRRMVNHAQIVRKHSPSAVEAGAWQLVLRHLALPYADRPGYREDWRP